MTTMKLDMTLDLTESTSATDWVTQSRIKENINKSKAFRAAQQQKKLEEEEEERLQQQSKTYTSSDLKGLHIKHGDSDFEMGKQVILTLADSDILEVDEHGKLIGLNEESDVLENVNIADKDRRVERENRIKRNRQPVYSALDDHEFKEGVAPGTKASILSQYDKEKKPTSQLVLGDNGTIERSTLAPDAGTAVANRYSLQTLNSGVKFASEFFTPKEYATFKAKSSGDRKKRKIRKASTEDVDEEETVQPTTVSSTSAQHSTAESNDDPFESKKMEVIDENAANTAVENILANEEAKKRENYERAVVRAAQISKLNPNFNAEVAENVNTKGIAAVVVPVEYSKLNYLQARAAHQKQLNSSSSSSARVSIDFDDDDRELRESLAKARRLAIATRKPEDNEDVTDKGAKSVLELTQSLVKEEVVMKTEGDEAEEIDADGRKSDGTLVFNSTTEFTSRLQARLTEKARVETENALKGLDKSSIVGGVTSSVNPTVNSSSASTIVTGKRKLDEEDEPTQIVTIQMNNDDEEDIYNEHNNNNSDDSDEYDDDDLDDEQMGFINQPSVAKGMAGTLALLKSTGELKKSDVLTGRAKDGRTYDPSSNDFDVKIEYRDEKGRKLTQKEAFRQLSYRFHGYGPGQKKKEKRMKAMDIQNKATSSRTGILEGSGGMMGSFAKTQEATGKAHITIQGGASNAAIAGMNLATLVNKKK